MKSNDKFRTHYVPPDQRVEISVVAPQFHMPVDLRFKNEKGQILHISLTAEEARALARALIDAANDADRRVASAAGAA
jgi:hypothetical protein